MTAGHRRPSDKAAIVGFTSYELLLSLACLVLLAWVFGWDFLYRPIPWGPAISPYTASLFIVLICLHWQAKPKTPIPEIDKRIATGRVISIFLLIIIFAMLGYGLWMNLIMHNSQLLGFPLTSTPTLLTIAALGCYEILRTMLKKPSLLIDLVMIPSVIWTYLSLLGHLTGRLYLTGSLSDSDVGLSLPTSLFCIIFLALAFREDRLSISAAMFSSVPWIRRAILWAVSIQAATPLFFIVLLEYFFDPSQENNTAIFIIMSSFLLSMLLVYTVFLAQMSATHNKLQTICGYTHKFKNNKGEWQSLEQFLADNYGLKISHGISIGAIPATEKHLKHSQKADNTLK